MDFEKASVDVDCLDFLKVVLFGSLSDPFEAASFRAYRDFNRTVPLKEAGIIEEAKRLSLRTAATNILRDNITELVSSSISYQHEYDDWHFCVCRALRSCYRSEGVSFTFGHSQKWLNMTMKYLYILGTYNFDGLFQFLHLPLDNYVFEIAEKEFRIAKPSVAWSKWDDYDGQYMAYQHVLRDRIADRAPLRWEFRSWNKAAQAKK